MTKMLFILPSRNKGGAEKVLYNIFENLHSFEKKIIIFEKQNYYLEGLINYSDIRLRNNVVNLIKTIRTEKPDIIIASHFHINIFLILLKKLCIIKSKVVVRQSFTLSSTNINTKRIKTIAKLYKYADLVIFQSNHMKNDFEEHLNFRFKNSKVIYNPVTLNKPKLNNKGEKFYLAVGRLSKVKNFSYLILKYKEQSINKNLYPLYILGKGPEKEYLQHLILKNNLEQKIKLFGEVENLEDYYQNTRGVIISSLNEGLPNVLLEALSFQCDVMVKKHPGGTEEVIRKVGLSENFVEEIDFTFSNIVKTQKSHHNTLRKHFSIEVIMEEYKQSFEHLLRKD